MEHFDAPTSEPISSVTWTSCQPNTGSLPLPRHSRILDGPRQTLALCPFERGVGIGEFVGVITKGLRNVDVMECETRTLEMTTADSEGASGTQTRKQSKCQIWHGRRGNFTRFINHSCKPNAQFQRFVWRKKEKVLFAGKGIEAGAELTVDYSYYYWWGLDKKCLCGEACCSYKRQCLVAEVCWQALHQHWTSCAFQVVFP